MLVFDCPGIGKGWGNRKLIYVSTVCQVKSSMRDNENVSMLKSNEVLYIILLIKPTIFTSSLSCLRTIFTYSQIITIKE